MGDIVHKKRGQRPLPIRDGLNPSRARVPHSTPHPLSAWEFLWHLISTQRHRHPEDNEQALEKRFHAGEVVRADATPLAPSTILVPGEDIYFYRTPAPERPVPYNISILFEDDHILVADKPPFMATMPRAQHITQTATVQLRRMTGNNELSPAHRLDRLTSGVLLLTKRREIRGAYQQLFADKKVTKTYHAIAADVGVDAPTVWKSRIHKVPGDIQGHIVEGEVNAITHVEEVTPLTEQVHTSLELVHGPQPPLARYTLRPATGKTHQLRLHMFNAGAAILGDPLYPTIMPAWEENMEVPLRLLAHTITFMDPLSNKERNFSTRHNVEKLWQKAQMQVEA